MTKPLKTTAETDVVSNRFIMFLLQTKIAWHLVELTDSPNIINQDFINSRLMRNLACKFIIVYSHEAGLFTKTRTEELYL